MKEINVYGIEIINNKPQITSRVIAEQLDKRHDHVLGKIKEVLTLPEYWEREYSYGKNNKAAEYVLDKDAFILLVMNYEGYNDFKRAYIKQFNEMYEQLKSKSEPLPQTFADALLLAYNQQIQLQEQAPKIEYYDRVLESESTFTTTQVSNDLNMSAMKVNQILCNLGIQYKQSNQYHLYSKYKPLKYAETRTKPYLDNKGSKKTAHYLVWTEIGRKFILDQVTEFYSV